MSQHNYMFNSSMSISHPQQTQMYAKSNVLSSGQQVAVNLLGQDSLNQSSFDCEKFINQSHHDSAQQPIVRVKYAAKKIQPGNQQQTQLNSSKPAHLNLDETNFTVQSQSGIERAKQMIGQKVKNMVDWGQFTNSLGKQDAAGGGVRQQLDTLRSFGKSTQRAINKMENVQTRNLNVELDGQQQTFGIMQNFNVFTPPAGKQFQLPVDCNDDSRLIAQTVRDGEGVIPNPKKSPKKLSITNEPFSKLVHKTVRPAIVADSRNCASAKPQQKAVTLNPNNQHGVQSDVGQQGVVIMHSTKMQERNSAAHIRQDGDHRQTRVSAFQKRDAPQSIRSKKSLRDLLTGVRQSSVSEVSCSSNNNLRYPGRPSIQPSISNNDNQPVLPIGQTRNNVNESAMYSSVYKVNSPKMLGSTQNVANQSQMINANNTSVLISQHNKRFQQEEYPCSAFFQNDENFEKDANGTQVIRQTALLVNPSSSQNLPANLSREQISVAQSFIQQPYSPLLSQKMEQNVTVDGCRMQDTNGNNVSSPVLIRGRRELVFTPTQNREDVQQQLGEQSQISCSVIDDHPPGNNQGGDQLDSHARFVDQLKLKMRKSQAYLDIQMQDQEGGQLSIQSNKAEKKNKQIYTTTSMNQIKLNSRESLSAMKNLSLQQKSPLAQYGHRSKMLSSGLAFRNQAQYKNLSPSFQVFQQQKETSQGRLSIASLGMQKSDNDDLPPDPMFQTRTLESPLEQSAQDHLHRHNHNHHAQEQSKFKKRTNLDDEKKPQEQRRKTIQSQMLKARQERAEQGNSSMNQGMLCNEIVAVAPKKNQLGIFKQSSDQATNMSILITSSELDQTQYLSNKTLQKNSQSTKTATNNTSVVQQIDKRQNYHQLSRPTHAIQMPQSNTNDSSSSLALDQSSNLKTDSEKKPPTMTMIRVDEQDEQGMTEEQKRQKKRENSFIRNGYEVYVEGTYIVNGRRKKKIKKRKLSKVQLEQHNLKIAVQAKKQRDRGNMAGAIKIEQELQALGEIGKQTMQLNQAQKVVTLKPSQISLKQTIGQAHTNIGKITIQKQQQKQISSHANMISPQNQMSPRIQVHQATAIKRVVPVQKINLSESQAMSSQSSTQQLTKVKIIGKKRGSQAQVQIPKKLFIKQKSSPKDSESQTPKGQALEESKEPKESPYLPIEAIIGAEAQDPALVTNLMLSSARSLNFRDPDLQLITSSRHLTLRDVSAQLFNSCQRFILHRMIYQKRFPELLKVFKSGFLTAEQLNMKDHHGNTALLLAAKLSAQEEEYLKCINFLFKQGCDGKIRDGNGWSLLDEAICQGNSRLLAIAFGWLNIHKKEKIKKNKLKLIDRLKQIPDFYCELHWECQSNWIPFLSKFAPSDDFQIWKVGSNIRLDFSLVGFKKLQNKRRRMSIMFRNAAEDEPDQRYKDIDIIMVNRDREILTNPMEDLDDDEKLAVLTDIMNADPVQNELNIKRQEWSPVQNFFGTETSHETVNDYDCSRYKLQIQAQVRSKKKLTQTFQYSYDSYFEGAENFSEETKLAHDPASFKMAKDVEKTVESQLWLSQAFPLQFSQFMEVLDTLAISGQASMQKINEFLQNDCLKDVVERNGFPVKIQVPIGMMVKATVTFGNFEYLYPADKEAFIRETFTLPSDCRLVSRKEGMKTLESKKKRMAVANVVI